MKERPRLTRFGFVLCIIVVGIGCLVPAFNADVRLWLSYLIIEKMDIRRPKESSAEFHFRRMEFHGEEGNSKEFLEHQELLLESRDCIRILVNAVGQNSGTEFVERYEPTPFELLHGFGKAACSELYSQYRQPLAEPHPHFTRLDQKAFLASAIVAICGDLSVIDDWSSAVISCDSDYVFDIHCHLMRRALGESTTTVLPPPSWRAGSDIAEKKHHLREWWTSLRGS